MRAMEQRLGQKKGQRVHQTTGELAWEGERRPHLLVKGKWKGWYGTPIKLV